MILGLGRSPGEGKGYPLQYSGLEKSMGPKSQTRLSDFHFHIIFNAGKVRTFPLRLQTKRMYTLTTIKHTFESSSHGNQRRKRNKRIQIGKEVRLSLFADGLLYIEHPKDDTK